MDPITETVGLIATFFSLLIDVGVIFQIQRIRKRGKSDDISSIMYFFVLASTLFWFIYAIRIRDLFVGISNGAGFIVVLFVLYFILKNRSK